MAKNDVSNPDPSILNLTEDDTVNLNPSKPDISKPDPPDPDLLKTATFIPTPNSPGLRRDVQEPAIALLTEISASLRELKDLGAQFMKLVDLPEAEDVGRQRDRNSTRIGRRSNSGIISSRTTYAPLHGKSSAANGDITEAEESRRDRRRTTGSDDSDIIAINEEDTGASTEGALKGFHQLQSEYGDLPPPELFHQMLDFDIKRHGDLSSLWTAGSESREDAVAWLREKDLVFSRDERCGFTFDTVALAQLGDLYNVKCQIKAI